MPFWVQFNEASLDRIFIQDIKLPNAFFREVAYMASGVEGFRNGVDEFMSSSTVLPPSTWDPKTRVDPPDNLPEANQRINPVRYGRIRSDNLSVQLAGD